MLLRASLACAEVPTERNHSASRCSRPPGSRREPNSPSSTPRSDACTGRCQPALARSIDQWGFVRERNTELCQYNSAKYTYYKGKAFFSMNIEAVGFDIAAVSEIYSKQGKIGKTIERERAESDTNHEHLRYCPSSQACGSCGYVEEDTRFLPSKWFEAQGIPTLETLVRPEMSGYSQSVAREFARVLVAK
jgi:hypothetical protein